MKALGIIRKIDDLGRVVIPKEVRDTRGWSAGQPMEMFMSTEGLVLRPYNKSEERKAAIAILERAQKFVKDGQDQRLSYQLQEVIDYLEEQ